MGEKDTMEVILFLLDDEQLCECLQPHKLPYRATMKTASVSSVVNVHIAHTVPKDVIRMFRSLHNGFSNCHQ